MGYSFCANCVFPAARKVDTGEMAKRRKRQRAANHSIPMGVIRCFMVINPSNTGMLSTYPFPTNAVNTRPLTRLPHSGIALHPEYSEEQYQTPGFMRSRNAT